MTFVPLLLTVHYARSLVRPATRLMARLPRSGRGGLDSAMDALSLPPEVVAAILHGILVGPIAPTIDERRAIDAPTLVIGHRADLIHPFSDAENLADDLPNARLVRGGVPFGLRFFPTRMIGEVTDFLDEVHGAGHDRSEVPGPVEGSLDLT